MSELTSQSISPSMPPPSLNCQSCRELLSDYVDRELTDEERVAVEQHLSTCTKCGSESHRLIGLKNVVQHWGGVSGSGEFRQSVVQQMIRESQQMPAAAFVKQAAAESSRQATSKAVPESQNNSAPKVELAERDEEVKTVPPIWIFFVAVALAVGAYFIVLKLRGM